MATASSSSVPSAGGGDSRKGTNPGVNKASTRDTELWSNMWCGGFPGGEAFFRQWSDDGCVGRVPGLEPELQPPEAPDAASGERQSTTPPTPDEEGPPRSNLNPADALGDPNVSSTDTTEWNDPWAAGFPGGEAFFRKWNDEGYVSEVPGLPPEMQPPEARRAAGHRSDGGGGGGGEMPSGGNSPGASRPQRQPRQRQQPSRGSTGRVVSKMVVNPESGRAHMTYEVVDDATSE